ncbi:hypothetical protein QTQ03_14735 [Micromonospora sp. WMMA1363]|uniref:hypothetical protein n=1 Tax=Micromonospora sp. WMMA1363 TaxID=3053985 RepID=UPI00259C8D5F|nr:hypothetical protein [Micromonospora sp. WMMA1363]MDM4720783.1 hypothetical protein [Micromonospora sp. WMMA1363]
MVRSVQVGVAPAVRRLGAVVAGAGSLRLWSRPGRVATSLARLVGGQPWCLR